MSLENGSDRANAVFLQNGKVTAVWAGSVIAYHDMIEKLRPEDFDIVYRSKNRFRFMGNGRTKR